MPKKKTKDPNPRKYKTPEAYQKALQASQPKLVRRDEWFLDEETGVLFKRTLYLDEEAFYAGFGNQYERLLLQGYHQAALLYHGIKRFKHKSDRMRKAQGLRKQEPQRYSLIKEHYLENEEWFDWSKNQTRDFIGGILHDIIENELELSRGRERLFGEAQKLKKEKQIPWKKKL